MAYRSVPGVVSGAELWLVILGPAPPDRGEWQEYVEAARAGLARNAGDIERLPTLLLSDGGAPDALQRSAINELQVQVGKTARVAFLSESTLTRGVTRALTWLNPKLKVFPPERFLDAFAYLGVPPERAGAVKGELLSLERDLDGMKLRALRRMFVHRQG
jgi:hypothetical protein